MLIFIEQFVKSVCGILSDFVALSEYIDFTKGQLISKCPYEKSVLSKIPTKKFPRFLP